MTENTYIARAVRLMGGLTRTAHRLQHLAPAGTLTPQAVYQWLERGYCPPAYAVPIEQLTEIPRELLIDPEIGRLFEGLCPDDQEGTATP